MIIILYNLFMTFIYHILEKQYHSLDMIFQRHLRKLHKEIRKERLTERNNRKTKREGM